MKPSQILQLVLLVFSAGLTQNVRAEERVYAHESKALTSRSCLLGGGSALFTNKFKAWTRQYKQARPDRCVDFNVIGGKAALNSLSASSSDFAVGDIPLSGVDRNARGALGSAYIGIGAVAPIYNLGGVSGLRLSKRTLVAIFFGEVTKWDDKIIRKDNPGINLPSINILLYHDLPSAQLRAGTDTKVFLQFITHAAKSVGVELPPHRWPIESNKYIGAEGAPGFVRNNYGALSYAWVLPGKNGFNYAAVENDFGEFVKPTSGSITAASQKYPKSKEFDQGLMFEPVRGAYPIVAPITIFYNVNGTKRSEIEKFIKWLLVDGQRIATKIGEPSLSREFVQQELTTLDTRKP